MDPLSGVLSLLKPHNTMCGGFDVGGEWSFQFPQHEGIKCYAVVSGQCWLSVEGVPEAVHLKTGDCFLLPLGRPFRLASDLALPPVDFRSMYSTAAEWWHRLLERGRRCLRCWRLLRPCRKSCRHPAGNAPADRAYQERIGQIGVALVHRADDAGAARAAAGQLSGPPAPRPHDAGPGPAGASGGRVERWRWMALRTGGSTNERGNPLDARRSCASLDLAGAGGACRDVAIELCRRNSRRPSVRHPLII